MIKNIIDKIKSNMMKSFNNLKNSFVKIHAGHAHPNILKSVMVDYYGNNIELYKVSNIVIKNERTLLIIPWDKNIINKIKKAIINSNLNLNPILQGSELTINIPPLNEETRKNFIRYINVEAENSKISIRNIRRNFNNKIKNLLKKKEINQDQFFYLESTNQKITDKYVNLINELLKKKREEFIKF